MGAIGRAAVGVVDGAAGAVSEARAAVGAKAGAAAARVTVGVAVGAGAIAIVVAVAETVSGVRVEAVTRVVVRVTGGVSVVDDIFIHCFITIYSFIRSDND